MRDFLAIVCSLVVLIRANAEVPTKAERNEAESASAAWKFKQVPAPVRNDAAAKAKFIIADGARDRNGGDVSKLNDGRMPTAADQPRENFFFNAGTDGGRISVDLGASTELQQINTYSWHPNTRGPQVYKLYGSEGVANGFDPEPKRGVDPATSGWTLLATVDTRPGSGEPGGQYGVSIGSSDAALGKFRYLLFDISRTEDADGFGNTFLGEIDVLERGGAKPEPAVASPEPKLYELKFDDYVYIFDTTLAPDLSEWAEKELAPVVRDWYPKIIKLLPSDGFVAPARVTLSFREDMGGTPASAGGSRINCNIGWFRRNLKGEAKGAVVHELVHIVQQYRRSRRERNASRPPGWLVEGIADYIRWFLYEPETKGAEITRRNLANARYDANYRISANFLSWVTGKYDPELVRKLNAAARSGRYREELWKEYTGKSVQELGDEWRKAMEEKFAAPATPTPPQ